MNDDVFRVILARQAAIYQAVEVMLAAHMASFGRERLDDHARLMIEQTERTDGLTGTAKNDFAAEFMADVTVRMHADFRELVARAKLRAEAGFVGENARER